MLSVWIWHKNELHLCMSPFSLSENMPGIKIRLTDTKPNSNTIHINYSILRLPFKNVPVRLCLMQCVGYNKLKYVLKNQQQWGTKFNVLFTELFNLCKVACVIRDYVFWSFFKSQKVSLVFAYRSHITGWMRLHSSEPQMAGSLSVFC